MSMSEATIIKNAIRKLKIQCPKREIFYPYERCKKKCRVLNVTEVKTRSDKMRFHFDCPNHFKFSRI